MKKFIIALLILSVGLLVAKPAHSQIVTSLTMSKTTLTAPDTATASIAVDNTTKSVKAYITRTSGTLAGKVYLIADFGDGDYTRLDSATIANGATYNSKVFAIPTPLIYGTYKIQVITSGSSTCTVTAKRLRRS